MGTHGLIAQTEPPVFGVRLLLHIAWLVWT